MLSFFVGKAEGAMMRVLLIYAVSVGHLDFFFPWSLAWEACMAINEAGNLIANIC